MIDDLRPEVERAARSTTRSWTGALDPEDVVQDMWVKVLESSKTVPALLSYEADQRGKVLRAIARQCAGAEIADREAFSGNATYSTEDVRRILESGGAGEIPGSPSHVEWLDAQAGLDALGASNAWYAEVIHSRYVVGDYSTANDKGKELTRAVDALTLAMNTCHKKAAASHEGPGSRKAIPNTTAMGLTRE